LVRPPLGANTAVFDLDARRPSEGKSRVTKFVTRQLRGEGKEVKGRSGNTLLARALTAASPQQLIINDYIDSLTGGSLQSAEELIKVASALGLKVRIDRGVLTPIFDARNKIFHELDICLDRDRRRRNHRGLQEMVRYTNTLLALAENILTEVNSRLP
jgi:hypothetical protein